ncbi:ras GTPase-activating protein 1-like [Pelecanus crispus]|uniref:ras GTPase-activating protein 1-like n=1 Tax=Pelecanus crispus TaxID=36300 RepID=UPI003F5D42C0
MKGWYHGKLDRAIAEERLWQAGKPGSYLIRESDRRPGSFVLSFLSKTNVNHFRIIAMCGDYYIGGRRFASLSDLIGYYSHVSCLLKGEKLFFPVAPPEPVEDRRRVRAILPYTKVPETDEISFLKGDMFIVHNELEDGWMWVTNLRTDEQGLIVEDLVEEVGREEDPHEGKIWFHGKISTEEGKLHPITISIDSVLYATCYSSFQSVPNIPFYFNALLLVLTLMNIYWFLYIILFVAKVLMGQMQEVNDVCEYDVENSKKTTTAKKKEAGLQLPNALKKGMHLTNGLVKDKQL